MKAQSVIHSILVQLSTNTYVEAKLAFNQVSQRADQFFGLFDLIEKEKLFG